MRYLRSAFGSVLCCALWAVGSSAGADSSDSSIVRTDAAAKLSASGLCRAGFAEEFRVGAEKVTRIVQFVARGLDASSCTVERIDERPDDWVEVDGDIEDGTLLALLADLERIDAAEFERRFGPGDYGGPSRVSHVWMERGVRVFYKALLGRGKRGYSVQVSLNPESRRFEVADIHEVIP